MRFKYFRLLHINLVLLKHGLDKIVWATPLFRPLYFLIIFFPWRWFKQHQIPKAEAIRQALEELGPIFVKFGQLLSTRRDVLPDHLANELAKLQDKVSPFPVDVAISTIEKSLQQSIDMLFLQFDLVPLGCASISQVHAATLQDGKEVVIKILRPHIHRQVNCDLALLETFAKLIHRYMPSLRRFHPIEIVHEIKCTLLDELDLLKEAANASQLRRNFANSTHLYVPQVYWEYSRSNLLVTERVYGTPISDIATLKAKKTNLKRLAERGVEIFFTQVFRDCFFHADMHPGNIFIETSDPENPLYIAVDFGIMGTIGPQDQRYLGENFLAFFKRDYRRVAELHVQSGWVPPHTRVESFETSIRSVCEPIFERPLKDISIGQTLLRLFQTARRFEMEVQPQLVLLQKTLLTIEGLGRELYPELDLWHTAKPFLEKWMKQHFGPRALFRTLCKKFPIWSTKMPELPEAIYEVLSFHQKETHYLSYRHAHASTKTLTNKNQHYPLKLLGLILIALPLVMISFTTQLQFLLEKYSVWLISLSVGAGLYCIFKF